MALTPTLFFPGTAASALEHYADALGGKIDITRYGGSPVAASASPEWHDKVLYGALHSPLGDLSAMDAPPDRAGRPGDNFAIAIQASDAASAERMFHTLAAGGEVLMPFEQTFFAERFGMLADKFGIRWMISFAPVAVPS